MLKFENCGYCWGSGRSNKIVTVRYGAGYEKVYEKCPHCGGSGRKTVFVAEPLPFLKVAEKIETTPDIPAEPRKHAAVGFVSLAAGALGLFVAGAIYNKTPEPGPALIGGGIVFFITRAILRWSPILALLRGAIWLLKVVIFIAIIATVLAAITSG